MDYELHLIILWEHARYKQNEILQDIQKQLKVLECYDIKWNKSNIAKNFTRFYGVKLDDNSAKEKECGQGRFLLITVLDENPKYDFVETSRGYEYANVNILKLKEKYRLWTGGGSKVHATNSVKECNHDITLLLGKNYKDYLDTAPNSWDGTFKTLNSDLTGTEGWKNLQEVFYVLNNTINYVVLRNHECLPEQFNTKEHGDIDILVDDYQNAIFLLDAVRVSKTPYRVHYKNYVNKQEVFWDLRHVWDNYYCREWEENILERRVINENNIYIQNSENYFYSLVYHAIVHKRKIATDYYDKAKRLFDQLKLDMKICIQDYPYPFDAYFVLLKQFMKKSNYIFSRPDDKSVYYNEAVINTDTVVKYLEKNFPLIRVAPIMINHYGNSYFKATAINGQKLFIKWGGIGDTCKNEFVFTQKLYEANPYNFVKPWFYKCDGDKKFIALDYVEGIPLDKLLAEDIALKTKEDILKQLENIADTLLKNKVIHRDIRPENLMLTPQGALKLIDNQFAVSVEKYKESKVVRKNPRVIDGLGGRYAPGSLKWDDMYSIAKIIENIGYTNNTKSILDKVKANVGKMKIKYPKRRYIIIRKKILRLLMHLVPIKSWRKKLRNKI